MPLWRSLWVNRNGRSQIEQELQEDPIKDGLRINPIKICAITRDIVSSSWLRVKRPCGGMVFNVPSYNPAYNCRRRGTARLTRVRRGSLSESIARTLRFAAWPFALVQATQRLACPQFGISQPLPRLVWLVDCPRFIPDPMLLFESVVVDHH